MIGYEYEFTNANGFTMISYNKTVNWLVDNQFDGEFTYKDITNILKVLYREPYEKWFGVIDEFILFQHFMDKKGVDKIVVIKRDVKLFGDD